jgi:hypothetical protein
MKLIVSTSIYCAGIGAFLSLVWGRNGQMLGLALLAAGLLVSTSFALYGRTRQA